MRRSLLLLTASLVAISACASGGDGRRTPTDAGPAHDGGGRDLGTALDLGGSDLGGGDLGVGVDLGADADLGTEVDLGVADLGAPDLGARDLGPPPGCTSAASCQDGLACNGVEACIAGTCRPGTAIVCDDGIACTTNTCGEPSGTCAFMRDDAACPAGSTCTAPTASGCATTMTCSESPCRLVSPQCGCSAGQACVISGAARACAAAGTGATGAACGTAGAGCAAGNLCMGVGATGTASACEHFCNTDADCTGAGAICLLGLGDGAGGTLPGVTLCSLSCNPITGGGCPSRSTCRIFVEATGAGRYLTHCDAPIGYGTEFSSCTDDSDCAAGYACLDLGYGNECRRWCNYTTGAGCSYGVCDDPFTVPVVIGGPRYGICN